jgi:hypothetical protein
VHAEPAEALVRLSIEFRAMAKHVLLVERLGGAIRGNPLPGNLIRYRAKISLAHLAG